MTLKRVHQRILQSLHQTNRLYRTVVLHWNNITGWDTRDNDMRWIALCGPCILAIWDYAGQRIIIAPGLVDAVERQSGLAFANTLDALAQICLQAWEENLQAPATSEGMAYYLPPLEWYETRPRQLSPLRIMLPPTAA